LRKGKERGGDIRGDDVTPVSFLVFLSLAEDHGTLGKKSRSECRHSPLQRLLHAGGEKEKKGLGGIGAGRFERGSKEGGNIFSTRTHVTKRE